MSNLITLPSEGTAKSATDACPRRKSRYGLSLGVIAALCLTGVSTAYATCQTSILPDRLGPDYLYKSADIQVDPALPIGSVLYTDRIHLASQSGAYSVACTSSMGVINYRGVPGAPDGGIYPSQVPGVGYRLAFQYSGGWWPWSPSYPESGSIVGVSQDMILQLVKTGDIGKGGSMTGLIAHGNIAAHSFDLFRVLIDGAIVITPRVPTCAVQSQDVLLNLGVVASDVFTGIGAEAPLGAVSNITLSCSGGQGATVGVNMVMTDAADPSNRTDLLPLSPSSTAKGVSVRLRRQGGEAISYGPDSADASAQNRFFIQDMGDGTLDIPIRGQMVQTGASVTGGSVQAAATFTMSYD